MKKPRSVTAHAWVEIRGQKAWTTFSFNSPLSCPGACPGLQQQTDESIAKGIFQAESKSGCAIVSNPPISDSERLDWLERNLLSMSHGRDSCSVLMDNKVVEAKLVNEARGRDCGPSNLRICAQSIREAVDQAIAWQHEPVFSEKHAKP